RVGRRLAGVPRLVRVTRSLLRLLDTRLQTCPELRDGVGVEDRRVAAVLPVALPVVGLVGRGDAEPDLRPVLLGEDHHPVQVGELVLVREAVARPEPVTRVEGYDVVDAEPVGEVREAGPGDA